MMVVVFGLPGSGKTYFARHLADRLSATHLSSDSVRKQAELMGQYDTETKINVYETLAEMATKEVQSGHDVVIDATFYKGHLREHFVHLAGGLNQKLDFIEVTARESTIHSRLAKSREDSEADFEVYEKIKGEFEPYEEGHLVLESDENGLDRMLEKALEHLGVPHG